jgi:hypothetical protein
MKIGNTNDSNKVSKSYLLVQLKQDCKPSKVMKVESKGNKRHKQRKWLRNRKITE